MYFKRGSILVGIATALAIVAPAVPASGRELPVGRRAIRKDSFNLRFNLTIKGEGTGEIYFHSDSAGNGYLLKLSDKKIDLGKMNDGKFSSLRECQAGQSLLPEPALNTILIKRRKENILVFLNDRAVLSAADGMFTRGAFAWRASGGLGLSNPKLQAVGDIYFADDFMRETGKAGRPTQQVEAHGSWTPISGRWFVLGPGHPETSAAVFQLCHSGEDGRPGVYKAGYWFWDNYIYAVSVRPGDDDDVAAMRFYEVDEQNHFLLKWNGPKRKIELVRVKNGNPTTIAQEDVAFLPRQWYRIKLMVFGDRFRAYVDDMPVFNERLPGAVCGAIGLEAVGKDVRFDDVQVFSLKCSANEFGKDDSEFLKNALMAAETNDNITRLFTERPTMKDWSTSEGAWEHRDGIEWTDSVYYDGELSWSPRGGAEGGDRKRGTVALILAPEIGELSSGYRLVCSFDEIGQNDAKTGWREIVAFRNGERVSARRENKDPGGLAIRVGNGKVKLMLGDEELFGEPLPERQGGFRFGRCAIGNVAGSFAVSSTKILDYQFARAPSDWISTGAWKLRPRWTCEPQFNWFGGKNMRGHAELWNKHKLNGDYTVEAYIACMLLGAFPRDYVFPINFRITVGADRMEPGRGYTCTYGFIDRPTEILRNGLSVASDASEVDATLWKDFEHARSEQVHRRWTHLKVQKKGSEIRFYVDRRLWLKFKDDAPLNGPYVSVSTERNGIMVSRVKITYENETGKTLVTR